MRITHQLRGTAIIGAAAMIAGVPTLAFAETATSSLGVTATVTENCTVSTAPVAFGAVDTLSGGNVDATGGVTVTCTNGTPWAASASAGSGSGATLATRKLVSGANTLNYALYTDSARSSVWGDGTATTATVANTGSGSAQSFTVYGRVMSGQASAPAGAYSDTVAVTISY